MTPPHRLSPVLLACLLALGLLASACVEPRCTRHSECPAGERCVLQTGLCEVPACTADAGCPTGQVCTDFACVAGCRDDAECGADARCYDKRCVPVSATCDCPLAPAFCAEDLAPRSPTAGTELCLPEAFPEGVALVFGSVMCSHCRDLMAGMQALRADLLAEGATAALAFVQIASVPVGSYEVGAAGFDDAVVVLPDSDEIGIWAAFHADWYHVIVVDRNGCLAGHFGPLTGSEVRAKQRDPIGAAWRAAATAPCQTGTPAP